MLSKENAVKLAELTGYGRGYVPEYGSDLASLVGACAVFGEWLERAVHAGHLPTSEGCEAALIARHLHAREELEELTAAGADGDVILLAELSANWYREVSAMLDRFAAEAERAAAHCHAVSPEGSSPTLRKMHAEDARDAEERARRAGARAAGAEEDNRLLVSARERYNQAE